METFDRKEKVFLGLFLGSLHDLPDSTAEGL